MYWLALEAAQWTYDQDAEENPTWSLDCRNGCIYTAKATLRAAWMQTCEQLHNFE